MDTTLVTVTILSMGMAAALSVIVWRLLREERRRGDARVAALAAAAGVTPAAPARATDAPVRRSAPVVAAFRPQGRVIDLPLSPAGAAREPASARPMFIDAPSPAVWGNRLGIITAIALVGAAALLFAMTASKARAVAAARAATATGPQVPAEARLELLSLRDTHENGTLTITGLVHNPRTAALLARVTVTAYTFDDKGAFLASGRALLDVTSLAPGDDSPFVVSVPVTDAVARYRVGFRGDDGRVIGHVDRRQQGPIAAVQTNLGDTHW
jgi:hypothetical protein